jgi:glutaredoxin
MKITVYSLPDCPKCDKLKKFLKSKDIEFSSEWFDTDNQADFVMMNVFGNPPILSLGEKEKVKPSEELFEGEILNEERVLEMLNLG